MVVGYRPQGKGIHVFQTRFRQIRTVRDSTIRRGRRRENQFQSQRSSDRPAILQLPRPPHGESDRSLQGSWTGRGGTLAGPRGAADPKHPGRPRRTAQVAPGNPARHLQQGPPPVERCRHRTLRLQSQLQQQLHRRRDRPRLRDGQGDGGRTSSPPVPPSARRRKSRPSPTSTKFRSPCTVTTT